MNSIKAQVLLLIFICTSSFLFAQADLKIPTRHFIDNAIIPAPSREMPDYVKLLYADQVDLKLAEEAFEAYHQERGWEHQKEDLEHDVYAKFFHHWYI